MLKRDRFSCSQKIWLKRYPPVVDLYNCRVEYNDNNYLRGTTLGLYMHMGNVILEECNMILTLSEHWILLDNGMCKMLSGIYELL